MSIYDVILVVMCYVRNYVILKYSSSSVREVTKYLAHVLLRSTFCTPVCRALIGVQINHRPRMRASGMKVHECEWSSMDAQGCVWRWIFMDLHGHTWLCINVHRCTCRYIIVHGDVCISADVNGDA